MIWKRVITSDVFLCTKSDEVSTKQAERGPDPSLSNDRYKPVPHKAHQCLPSHPYPKVRGCV